MSVRNTLILLLLILCAGMPFSSAAQKKKPVRVEIPVKDDTELYKVVPCDENGCAILFLSSENSKDGQMIWVTSFLDNKLKEKRRYNFELPRGFILEEALYKNDRLLAFFYTKRASADTNFYLVDFNLRDSMMIQMNYPVPGRAGLSHFAISDEYAIAGINTRDDRSVILQYNLGSKSINIVSPGISNKTVIESAGVNKLTGGFSLILRTTQTARKRDYYVVKFTRNGEPYYTHLLSKFQDLLINNAFMHEINKQSDIIIGSYGTSSRTRNFGGEEMIGVASTGFFSIVINENQEEIVHTYDFTEFDKFYRYLRRPNDIAPRRTLLRRERPSRDLSTDHNLLSHEIIRYNDEFIFMAEAYYPEYRIITTMVYDYYGRPYPSTYTVFEGYRYLTTFIAGFDNTGELKWNNDLELTNTLTQSLRERVTPHFVDTTGIMLSYVDNDRIAYKIIDKGKNLTNVSYSKVDPLHLHDKVQKESNSYILPWYKDYFLIHGYQTIRNSYSSEKAKSVFYLSKMAFRL